MNRMTMKTNADQKPHWIEWLTGLIATLVILAVTGWILWEAWSTDERPPELTARVVSIEPVPSGWRAMIEVRNGSDETAAAVEVKAALMDGTTPIEEVQVTFDYIAAGSSSRGGFLFASDPSRYRLKVAPTAFTEP